MSTRKHHPKHTAGADDQAQPYGIKARPTEAEMPTIAGGKVSWLQKLLIDAGFPLIGKNNGADGAFGESTLEAAKHIADEAKIKLHDVNFNDPNSANYKAFMEALAVHKRKHDEVKVELKVAPTGPTPEELAAKARAEAAAREAAARAAEDAKIPASIRNTEYDPRKLAKLNQDQRYALSVRGLAAVNELKSENSTPNLERIHDKMAETVRDTNKKLGTTYPIPTDANPLSDEALMALGQRVAARDGLTNRIPRAGENIPTGVNGTQYDPRIVAGASDAQLTNILKDGLYGLHEISGGIFGSYHRNGQLGDVTTAKVFEQERKLLGIKRGEESLDRKTLEQLATAMGVELTRRDGLTPNMATALTAARTSGALPPKGAVADVVAANGDAQRTPVSTPGKALPDQQLTIA